MGFFMIWVIFWRPHSYLLCFVLKLFDSFGRCRNSTVKRFPKIALKQLRASVLCFFSIWRASRANFEKFEKHSKIVKIIFWNFLKVIKMASFFDVKYFRRIKWQFSLIKLILGRGQQKIFDMNIQEIPK